MHLRKGKYVPIHGIKAYRKSGISGIITPFIINLSIRWR
jgi:hypothetical protein